MLCWIPTPGKGKQSGKGGPEQSEKPLNSDPLKAPRNGRHNRQTASTSALHAAESRNLESRSEITGERKGCRARKQSGLRLTGKMN